MRSTVDSIDIPEVGLVVLCGASGVGKSSFAGRHFVETEIVSSDRCRAMVSDDETDQSVTGPAFDLLHSIVDKRLEAGRLAVVDATNVRPEDRRSLVDIARRWDVRSTAIVFDLSLDVCLERNAARTDRQTPENAIRRQHKTLRRSVKGMRKERFGSVFTFGSVEEVEGVTITRTKLWNDKRDDAGPFDIIGDVHGCDTELLALLDTLGYDTAARPIRHPEGRRALFLGDLVDRGPGSDNVLELAMDMIDAGHALCILGNHENKLSRALSGRNVTVSHGLAETLQQLDGRDDAFRERVKAFLGTLVSHYVLDDGRLVVAHAGLPERYHGRASGRVRSLAMYGDTDGETDEYGLPVRYPWADEYKGAATVVYGHTPVPSADWHNNTICLDTGAVFGGELTALRWPERELMSVPATEVHYEPVRPLIDERPERSPSMLDVTDVLGRLRIDTAHAGRVTIDEEHSSAAIEVMSRFAVDPRWLVHLPPTMSPVATSARDGLLEHPDEVFADFRRDGVAEVVCQEKHMGSRAVIVLAKDGDAAQARFGITNAAAGVIVTRTGRSFFTDDALTNAVLDGVRSAIDTAGIWGELETDWMVLDTELLPWSAKARELIRTQYASVGAAGSAMLGAASAALSAAVARGVDIDDVADRAGDRSAHLARYVNAYRQYCWPTDGIDGIEVAPFQILAAEGEVYARRPHRWHLDLIDRLVAANPSLIRRTDRRFVRLDDEASVADATQWWADITAAGGEGMVAKPAETVVMGEKGMVLPGVKCRGPEYLRIIYGPEYLEPGNLERLRKRGLGKKRSLARREFALGIEALDRFVAREHLGRVHECVFGVLALESQPVDPRL